MKAVWILMSILMLAACGTPVGFSNKPGSSGGPTADRLGDDENNIIPPLVCSAGSQTGSNQNYYPTSCLLPQAYPAQTVGVQINNAYLLANKVFSISSNSGSGTSQDTVAYIEISTYVAPDTIVIRAQSASGSTTELLNICNISTYSLADPTNGTYRPYSSTILQFHVNIPRGTKKIIFDYSASNTPTFVGLWNLAEFSQSLFAPTTNPFYGTSLVNQFRPVNTLPSPLNDNQDPLQSANRCQ